MMKRWISMLLALMLGMATAEDAPDDAWEYELVGRAIELVRQMDAQERGRLFEDTLAQYYRGGMYRNAAAD